MSSDRRAWSEATRRRFPFPSRFGGFRWCTAFRLRGIGEETWRVGERKRRQVAALQKTARCHQLLLVLLVLLTTTIGCNPPESAKPKLYFLCGAGLRPAAEDLAEAFQREHDVAIESDFSGSEILLSRLTLSDQGDLFMPGDVYYVDQAKEKGMVAEGQTVCYFVPVIIVQKGNPRGITSLADLTAGDIALGLGDPKACAIGRKTSKIFEKNNIDESALVIETRSVTVNELANYVTLEQLDAAIVWDAVAAMSADTLDIVPIPVERNVISTVVLASLKRSKHPTRAKQFLDFVTSEQGREILSRHHYTIELNDAP